MRIRPGDPPYRGSCPRCQLNSREKYKRGDLDNGSSFINTLRDAGETIRAMGDRIFWVLLVFGLVALTASGFLPRPDEEEWRSDEEYAQSSSSQVELPEAQQKTNQRLPVDPYLPLSTTMPADAYVPLDQSMPLDYGSIPLLSPSQGLSNQEPADRQGNR